MPEDYSVIVRGVGPCGRGMTVRMRLSGSKLAKPVRRTIVQAYCKHAATKGFAIDRDRVEECCFGRPRQTRFKNLRAGRTLEEGANSRSGG